jgi:hypothetical protein
MILGCRIIHAVLLAARTHVPFGAMSRSIETRLLGKQSLRSLRQGPEGHDGEVCRIVGACVGRCGECLIECRRTQRQDSPARRVRGLAGMRSILQSIHHRSKSRTRRSRVRAPSGGAGTGANKSQFGAMSRARGLDRAHARQNQPASMAKQAPITAAKRQTIPQGTYASLHNVSDSVQGMGTGVVNDARSAGSIWDKTASSCRLPFAMSFAT